MLSRPYHCNMKSKVWLSSLTYAAGSTAAQYAINPTGTNASQPFDGFVSYSIEFSSFPDFAGKCDTSSDEQTSRTECHNRKQIPPQ